MPNLYVVSSGPPIRPRIRYFWEGHRFAPGHIAPSEHGAWVTEGLLPLLAHVDARTGEITGPFDLAHPDRPLSQIHSIAAEEGFVWLRTNDQVRWFDPGTGRSGDIAARGSGLAADAGTIWTGAPGPCIAKVDATWSGLTPVAPVALRHRLLAAHGHLWVAEWQDADTTSLSRIDPAEGTRAPAIERSGTLLWLVADDEAVWMYLRPSPAHDEDPVLLRIDPSAAVVTNELRCDRDDGPGLVVRGELWLQSIDRSTHDQRAVPHTIRRLDGCTGELLGEIELSGWLHGPVASRDGLWGHLGTHGRHPDRIVHLAQGADSPVIADFDSLDLTPFLPPPPVPIDAGEMERAARDDLAATVTRGWTQTDPVTGEQRVRPFITGITFEDVRLEGEFPDTGIVMTFRAQTHPGVLFARARRLWADDGAWDDEGIMAINLMEDVEASGYGLPVDPIADESGIVWF